MDGQWPTLRSLLLAPSWRANSWSRQVLPCSSLCWACFCTCTSPDPPNSPNATNVLGTSPTTALFTLVPGSPDTSENTTSYKVQCNSTNGKFSQVSSHKCSVTGCRESEVGGRLVSLNFWALTLLIPCGMDFLWHAKLSLCECKFSVIVAVTKKTCSSFKHLGKIDNTPITCASKLAEIQHPLELSQKLNSLKLLPHFPADLEKLTFSLGSSHSFAAALIRALAYDLLCQSPSKDDLQS